MLFYRPKPRTFRYRPRFYKEDEDLRSRIKFQRRTHFDPHRSGISYIKLFILIIIVTLLFAYVIPRLSNVVPEKMRIDSEDVIHLNTDEENKLIPEDLWIKL